MAKYKCQDCSHEMIASSPPTECEGCFGCNLKPIGEDRKSTSSSGGTGYVVPRYSLTVRAEPLTAGEVTGAGVYCEGKQVTLTAIAKTDWQFDLWRGALESFDESAVLLMDEDKTVVAHFVKRPVSSVKVAPPPVEKPLVKVSNPTPSSKTFSRIRPIHLVFALILLLLSINTLSSRISFICRPRGTCLEFKQQFNHAKADTLKAEQSQAEALKKEQERQAALAAEQERQAALRKQQEEQAAALAEQQRQAAIKARQAARAEQARLERLEAAIRREREKQAAIRAEKARHAAAIRAEQERQAATKALEKPKPTPLRQQERSVNQTSNSTNNTRPWG